MKTPEEIRADGRSETIRTLARTGITCMAYDAIADMMVKAVRMIDPALDELVTEEPPEEFLKPNAVIGFMVKRAERSIPFNDLIDDLWSDERVAEIRGKLSDMVNLHNIYKHTLRGEIRRDLQNDDYLLIVSGLEKV